MNLVNEMNELDCNISCLIMDSRGLARKILHRDIKTMNVFLGENKSIKIGDLGVARTMTGDFASTIVGSPYYLSP